MKNPALIFTFCLAVFSTACGAAKSEKPASAATTKAAASSTDASTSVTNVAACDEYLVKVEKFLDNENVPQETRNAYRQTLEQNRTAWRQAALTPQSRAQLETSCQTAADSIKPVLEQYDER